LIIGNLLAAYVIVDIPTSEFFMGLCGLVVLTAIFFIILPTPDPQMPIINDFDTISNVSKTPEATRR
jgi:hypothetical protein